MPHPSRGDKLRRAVWGIVDAALYRHVPRPLFGVRRLMLRAFGAKVAGTAKPYPSARIYAPWHLEMRAHSAIGARVKIYNVAPILLLEDCTVSQDASLCTASHDFRSPDFALVAARIIVGRGAWVAAEAFLGPGVILGDGAVVGARAVVVRSVPPHAVVAGNPARVVSERVMKGSGPIAAHRLVHREGRAAP